MGHLSPLWRGHASPVRPPLSCTFYCSQVNFCCFLTDTLSCSTSSILFLYLSETGGISPPTCNTDQQNLWIPSILQIHPALYPCCHRLACCCSSGARTFLPGVSITGRSPALGEPPTEAKVVCLKIKSDQPALTKDIADPSGCAKTFFSPLTSLAFFSLLLCSSIHPRILTLSKHDLLSLSACLCTHCSLHLCALPYLC